MIDWSKISKFEYQTIRQLAKRSAQVASAHGVEYDFATAEMDLAACHTTCPLDLRKLELASEFDFAHDVFGIRQHLNRETGELMDCFVPRCALPETLPQEA